MEANLSKWKTLGYMLIGVCFLVLSSASSYAAGVDTVNNNFTMINGDGLNITGGSNDVRFIWDGTRKTSVAASHQVSNAALSSTCPFFGFTWSTHDMAIYGPGTYTVYSGCPAGSPGCGLVAPGYPPVTFTVGQSELGVHALLDWNVTTDIDLVNVWTPHAVFGPSPMCTDNPDASYCSNQITCGGTPDTPRTWIWDWMSKDWDGDGINGSPFVDGPFIGFSGNFNVMETPSLCAGKDCNDNNSCTIDTCDSATGVCVHTPIVCNDNNVCTTDTCNPATGCVYTPIVCNDNNKCTYDTCDPATGCKYSPVQCLVGFCDPETGLCTVCNCNDNNACTVDTCNMATGCVYTPINCDDNNACTVDSCNPATGCVHTPVTCPTGQTCDPVNGNCGVVNLCTGKVCNDNEICTADACDIATGTCVHTPVSNGIDCSPELPGGTAGSCFNGMCVADAKTIVYEQSPGHFGGFSSDGKVITVADDFQLSQRTQIHSVTWWGGYGSPNLSTPSSDNFTIRLFSDNGTKPGALIRTFAVGNNAGRIPTGNFVNPPDSSGFPGRAEFLYSFILPIDFPAEANQRYWLSIVNVPSSDSWVWEVSGSQINLGVQRSFSDPVFGPWALYYDNTAFRLRTTGCGTCPLSCDDGNLCTDDFCDATTCQCVHTPKNCDDNNACTADSCSSATGCIHTPIINCTVVDTVNNNFTMIDGTGATFGGTNDVHFTWDGTKKTSVAVSGQVSNATISSTCSFFGHTWAAHDVAIYGPGTYTVYDGCPAGSPGCGVGNPVTFTVSAGQLGGHMLFFWNGNDNMDVVDVWQPGVFAPSNLWTGACGSNPADKVWDMMSTDWDADGINGAPMTDGPFAGSNVNFNFMEVIDLCANVTCPTVMVCNSPLVCDPSTGQCVPVNSSCDDGNACTKDSCNLSTGQCVHTPINCDDNNACTTDICDPATGCVHYAVNVNDNNACTIDTCDPARGAVFIPVNCDDNNACTADSCNPATGCVHTPIGCDDSNACTADSCDPATGCVHAAISCDDGNACTADSCNPATGCIHSTISCDDNNVCTTDSCDPASGCVNTTIPNCVVCAPGSPASVTLTGGGQNPNTVDKEIQTSFTVVNHSGCILSFTKSSVTVSVGTILQYDVTAGPGPQPSSCTFGGAVVPCGTNQITLTAAGTAGKLVLDNKANGGSDTDRITISAQ